MLNPLSKIYLGVILLLVVALGLTWFGYQGKKVALAECKSGLAICEKDVQGFQSEVTSMNGIIEKLKANLAGIKKQLREWERIANEAQAYSVRLLAAAEAKVDCEVYNAENARLTDEFVDGFNNSVRRKVSRPAPAGDRAADEVVPAAPAPDAGKGDK